MYLRFNYFALSFVIFICHPQFSWSDNLHPVIFVPGDGGSQVNAKLNKTTVVHYICQKKTDDFFNLWLNIELLVPVVIDCWIDNMLLHYDNITRTTKNSEGVEIQIPGFGNSSSVEWIDPSQASPGAYFKDIANALVENGYVRDVSIRGAPYDFRKGPNENQDYFTRLTALVEETYKQNNNQSIIFIAHSMGGPMLQVFFKKMSQQWKDTHVRAVISLCGAWAGSVKALKVYVVGDNLGAFILRESVVKAEQISSPSLAWLMPSKLFWHSNEVLVQTDKRNYTIDDFQDFFNDIGYPVGWEMYKDMEPFASDFTAPGVEIHCLYGYGMDTTDRLFYKSGQFPTSYPTLISGDGDGTVNRRSLEACLNWQKLQKQKIYGQGFQKVDHMQILRSKDVISYITEFIKKA